MYILITESVIGRAAPRSLKLQRAWLCNVENKRARPRKAHLGPCRALMETRFKLVHSIDRTGPPAHVSEHVLELLRP